MFLEEMLFILTAVGMAASGHVDLSNKYPFTSVLLNDAERGYYTLHWSFRIETKMIYFAVNVSTTGWVGFGLSPNGGMPGSDVVIGWVNERGVVYFKDRYATAESLPPVDDYQDWCLTSAEEEDEYTILEFKRNFTTCDDRDRDITSDTARVIWSFNPSDPTDDNDANLLRHTQRGSASLNLLGGDPNPNLQLLSSESYFDIAVSNVDIPPYPTVYWCATFKLPSEFVSTTHFINRITPIITPHSREFVHHLLVYLCPRDINLSATEIGQSLSCTQFGGNGSRCLSDIVLGGWAVGGNDFLYPEGVSYPIGGIGQEHFVVIEVHYDNPMRQTGVIDSSGLRFYYNRQEPVNRAGIMYLGHDVRRSTIIPPRSKEFTISSFCSAECTSQYIPEDGITMVGNLLHTHLAGRSLKLRHYRRDNITNQLVELEPMDQDQNYDFNFQQFTHLTTPRKILPGDTLVLECTYDTTDRAGITFGGPSTRDEMCLSFPIFYPRPADGSALVRCSSRPIQFSSFALLKSYIIDNDLATAENLTDNFYSTLETLDWTGDPMLATSLRNSLLQENITSSCIREDIVRSDVSLSIPSPDVQYVAPDLCSGISKGQFGPSCLADNTDGAITDGAIYLVPCGVLVIVIAVLQCLAVIAM